jgi:membrane-associated phospholipid phosphatase
MLQRSLAVAFSCIVLVVPGLDAQQSAGSSTDQNASTPLDTRDRNLYVDQGESSRSFVKKFSTNALLDQKEIWASPFHVDRSSAKWWLLAAGGAAALIASDHPISQALPHTGTTLSFGNNFARAGQWYSVYPFAGALYITGWATHDDKLGEAGALGLQALVAAGIVATVLKVVARRERPNAGDGGGHFETGGGSFPSGHSTEAWAIASVVAGEYGNHRWVPFVSYAYASVVSLSRVLGQQHFSSDVFVGGALGFFIGKFVVRTQRTHANHLKRFQWKGMMPAIEPGFGPGNKTISLVWGL